MLDRKDIRLEKERGYFSRLLSDTRFLLLLFAIIIISLIGIFITINSVIFAPLFILFAILNVIFFIMGIYIGSSDRMVIFDKEGIEVRFGVFSQKSLWNSLEDIKYSINPTMKKEQIVFKEKERSWTLINLDYKEESWGKLKELIYNYADKYKIKIDL
jgi:hypothetical protein